MSYFDDIQDNMKINQVVKKFQNFDQFYYNVKKIMNSVEFKSTGSGFISNNYLTSHSFHREIHFKNYTVYVNSGLICTSISLQKEYYRGIQCSAIVSRQSTHKSKSLSSTERSSETKSSSSDKDDSSTNPLNPCNPMSW